MASFICLFFNFCKIKPKKIKLCFSRNFCLTLKNNGGIIALAVFVEKWRMENNGNLLDLRTWKNGK